MTLWRLPALPQLVIDQENRRNGILIALLYGLWCIGLVVGMNWWLGELNQAASIFCLGSAWIAFVIAAIISGRTGLVIFVLLLAPILFFI